MRNLQHFKAKRTRNPKATLHKPTANCTPNNITHLLPQRVATMQCPGTDRALWDFKCARLKLLNILRRHEKIASILMDVQHRIEPIRVLLTTADERNMLNAEQLKAGQSLEDISNLTLCGLILHNFQAELQVCQVLKSSLDGIKELDLLGEQRYAKGLRKKAALGATVGHQWAVGFDEGSSNWTKFINDWHHIDEMHKLEESFACQLKVDNTEQPVNTQATQMLADDRNWQEFDKLDRISNLERSGAQAAERLVSDVVEDNSDWKKILNELNDWCILMDSTPAP